MNKLSFRPQVNEQGKVLCTIRLRNKKDITVNYKVEEVTTVLMDYDYDVVYDIAYACDNSNSNYKLISTYEGYATVEVKQGDIEFILIPIIGEVKDDITRKDTNVPSTTRRTKNTK